MSIAPFRVKSEAPVWSTSRGESTRCRFVVRLVIAPAFVVVVESLVQYRVRRGMVIAIVARPEREGVGGACSAHRCILRRVWETFEQVL